MIKGGDKRGLSEIITNVLLILLVLVAIGVVWVVIRNIVSGGAGDIELGQFSYDLQIQSAYVSGTDVVVSVRRNAGGGALLGMKFIFSNETDSVTAERRVPLNALDRRTFTFSSSEVPGIGGGDEVSVAPIYESGGEKTGGVTDSATISGTPPPGAEGGNGDGTGAVCGNDIIESGETCDDGNTISGDGCSSTCQSEAVPVSCNGVWEATSEDFGVECDGTPLPNGCAANCVCEQGFTLNGAGGCTLNPAINTGAIFSVWNNIYFDSNDLPKSDAVTGYIGDYVNFSGSAELGCFQITFADYLSDNDISYVRLDDSPPLGVPNIAANDGYSIWEAANCGQ
ncbi:MAG: hypothetical protein Q8P79_02775 [Nanoarchaeota archaeon]|nr:hypothetical protein [Nanoarchaeota archaeon]